MTQALKLCASGGLVADAVVLVGYSTEYTVAWGSATAVPRLCTTLKTCMLNSENRNDSGGSLTPNGPKKRSLGMQFFCKGLAYMQTLAASACLCMHFFTVTAPHTSLE